MGATVGASGGEERPVAQAPGAAQIPGDATAAPTATPAPTPDPVDELSLQQQVGRLVVLRFNGTTVPSYVRNVLHNGWASGAILFKANVTSPEQLATLTAALRKSGQGRGRDADHLHRPGGRGDPQRDVGAAHQRAVRAGPGARREGQPRSRCARPASTSRLAPVADVPSVDGAAMAGREFSRDPARVATATRAAIGGWLAGGVKPTVKHFPGLGGATVNTDQGSATIRGGAPTDADLAPFKAAIAAKVPIVMSAQRRLSATGCAPYRVAVAGDPQDAAARAARGSPAWS